MGLFDRRRKDVQPDASGLPEALLQGQDAIEQTGRAHSERWGLGSAQRWDLDQEAGVIRWTFGDHVAEAPVQVLGSHSPAVPSWLWAWGNTSLPPSLCTASIDVREWGIAHGHAALTTPHLEGVSEEQAGDLACIAFGVLRSTGFYAAPAGRTRLFLVFGAVTITGADREQQRFEINFS